MIDPPISYVREAQLFEETHGSIPNHSENLDRALFRSRRYQCFHKGGADGLLLVFRRYCNVAKFYLGSRNPIGNEPTNYTGIFHCNDLNWRPF